MDTCAEQGSQENTQSVNGQILKLAWPAIATNITTPLLSLADVAITGHFENGSLIGAIAVGGTVFNIVYWIFAFLRMGTSGLTAQAFGANDKAEQRYIFCRGTLIALSGAALVLILVPLGGENLIALVDGGNAVQTDAWRYFRVAVIGAPGVLVSYVVSGWLLGMQRPKPIMWIALITNLLNIVLSLLFVYCLGLGIVGVALGTAASQIIGAAIGMFIAVKVLRSAVSFDKRKIIRKELFNPVRLKSMFSINRDIFLRTVCLAAVTLWFTHSGATLGKEFLTANALLIQLFLVFSYFMDGFAFGGEALAGRYYGARDFNLLRKTVRALFVWGVYTSLLFTVLYFFVGDVFLQLLTDDATALAKAKEFGFWAVTIPLTGFAAFTWDGIMIGLTRSRYLLMSMSFAMAVFFAVYFLGIRTTENVETRNHILWLAFVLYLVVRGAVSSVLYKRFIRKLTSGKLQR